MDPRSFRFRYFVAAAFITVALAAVLRHVLHVYGGMPREDIRANALIAILIIGTVMFVARRVSRR